MCLLGLIFTGLCVAARCFEDAGMWFWYYVTIVAILIVVFIIAVKY